MDQALLDEARERAEKILISNSGELGILGSRQAYQQVWARDSMICGLGLWLCKDGSAVHQRSMDSLRQFQTPLGHIPHNIGYSNIDDPALVALGGRLDAGSEARKLVADTTHAGVVDSNLWYIIGQYYHYCMGHDIEYLHTIWPSLQQALLWLRY